MSKKKTRERESGIPIFLQKNESGGGPSLASLISRKGVSGSSSSSQKGIMKPQKIHSPQMTQGEGTGSASSQHGEQERKRWRELEPLEVDHLKALQRGTFDKAGAESDGLKLSEDGSLCNIGRPIYIDAGNVDGFAQALTEAFPAKSDVPLSKKAK